MMPLIYEYEKLEDYAQDAAAAIEDFVNLKLEEQESVSIALSGGKSPIAVYRALAKSKTIDWDKIELFMVDERYVSQNSDQSNFRMIEQELLSKIAPIKFFYGFNTDLPLEKAAEAYDQILEARGNKAFDLVLLGMGEDGHTASLFPESEALNEKTKLAISTHSPDKMERLTITLPAILSAERILFLIQGKQKKTMLSKLQEQGGPEEKIPAKMILKHPHVELFFLNH